MTMVENGKLTCQILKDEGFEAFFVGGCVRDMKMEIEPHDIDITTNATPDTVQLMFPFHIDTGLQHGTVTVKPNKNSDDMFEVTTYRIDGDYDDGRHPNEVIFTTSLEKDLSRRDFTINAIAFDPINNIFMDPFHGESDIKNKVIKCVGIAKNRFMEDPLRVLRAMRFAIRFGFTIENTTKEAMLDSEVLEKLEMCVSKERITDELRKMLTCGKPIHDIFMEFSEIIAIIIPQMILCINAQHNNNWHKHDIYEHMLCVVDDCNTTKFEIKMAALLHDIGKPACRTHGIDGDHFNGHPQVSTYIANDIFDKELKIPNKEKEEILILIEEHDRSIIPDPKIIRRMIVNMGEQTVKDWIILKRADLNDHKAPIGKEANWNDTLNRFDQFIKNFDIVLAEENAFKIKDLEVGGKDIIDTLNIKPGPRVGEILQILFDAVLDEKVPNEKETLIALAQTL